MTKNVDHHGNCPDEKDCGCGCEGAGDCNDTAAAAAPKNKARRALMVGAGSVGLVATLINRRAFATGAQCGPISHAGSLAHSQQGNPQQCGGLTPGYWKNHKTCTVHTIGGTVSQALGTKLGAKLTNLAVIDSTSANTT